MAGQILLLGVFLVIVACTLIVKVATIALMLTGLDEKRARFQALSAFTGTGFTTAEAEIIMSNDRRRKIVRILMILGHSTLAVVIATLITSFIKTRGFHIPLNIVVFAILLYIFYRVATRERWIKRWDNVIENWINRKKIVTEKKVRDVLQFDPRFGIMGVTIQPGSQLAGKTVSELQLPRDKIIFLTIQRAGKYIYAPSEKQDLQVGDYMILYGRRSVIQERFAQKR